MRRITRIGILAGATLIALSSVSACGSDDQASGSSKPTGQATSSSTSAPPTQGSAPSQESGPEKTATITIKDFKYKGPTTVSPGTKVTVKNEDSSAHTVTADDGSFDVVVAPGKSGTFTAPAKAGSFDYHCTYHSNMSGTLTVG